MKCKYCNAEIAPNIHFCTMCGADLSKFNKRMKCSEIRICKQFDMYCELFGRTKAILLYCIFIPLFLAAGLWGLFDDSTSIVMKVISMLFIVSGGWTLWSVFTERIYEPGKYARWSKERTNNWLTYGGIVSLIIVILICCFIYMEERRITSWMAFAFINICGFVYYINYSRKSFQVHEDVNLVSLKDMENIMGEKIDATIQATYQNFDSSRSVVLPDESNIMAVSDRKIFFSFLDDGKWSFVTKNINDIVKLGFFDYSYMNKKQYLKLVFCDGTSIMLHMAIYGKMSSNATLFIGKFYEVLDAVVMGTVDGNTSSQCKAPAYQEANSVENQCIENEEFCRSKLSDDVMQKLNELKTMQEAGLISEEEYNTCKDAILKQFISE